MDVTTDVAARTREVTGVEPASGPATLAGWTCGDATGTTAAGARRRETETAKPRVAGKRNLTLNREAGTSPSPPSPGRPRRPPPVLRHPPPPPCTRSCLSGPTWVERSRYLDPEPPAREVLSRRETRNQSFYAGGPGAGPGAGPGPAGLRCRRGHVLPCTVPGGYGVRALCSQSPRAGSWVGAQTTAGDSRAGGSRRGRRNGGSRLPAGFSRCGAQSLLSLPYLQEHPLHAGAWGGVHFVKLGTSRTPNKSRRLFFLHGEVDYRGGHETGVAVQSGFLTVRIVRTILKYPLY